MKIIKQTERTTKALANGRRLAIVSCLKRNNELSVGNIAGEIHLSFKSTSKHLRILLLANILERRQVNLQMFYRLLPIQKPFVRKLIEIL